MVVTERRILTDIIKMYKDYRYLWDTNDVMYTNKEARDAAFRTLLEKYQTLYEDASTHDIKKRIENMRTTYRREHKKVLKSRMMGNEYIPTLWYYDHLEFLNDIGEWNLDSTSIEATEDETAQVMCKDEQNSSSNRSNPRRKAVKRRRSSESDSYPTNHVYLTNDLESNEVYVNERGAHNTESEAFGKTIGLQLMSLEPLQRHIAEKLISDVIFSGRLNKLTVDSCIMNLSGGSMGLDG